MEVVAYSLDDPRRKGRYLPLYALLAGLLLWLLDALVDVYVLQPQPLLENLLFPPLPDALLRVGVLLLLVVLALVARNELNRLHALQQELLGYKKRIEELVEEGRDPADPGDSQITALEDRIRELEEVVTADSLTRFYNRRKFADLLDHELARKQRYHNPLSIILVDIDRYSQIANTHGPATGEAVIRSVASCIRARIRNTDHPARWAEDGFAILALETQQSDALRLAQQLVEDIDDSPFDILDVVSISCGVTEAQHQDDVAQLIERGMEALRLARVSGGNKVEVL